MEESMMSLPFLRLTLGRETQSTVLSSDKRAAILQEPHKHKYNDTQSVTFTFACLYI